MHLVEVLLSRLPVRAAGPRGAGGRVRPFKGNRGRSNLNPPKTYTRRVDSIIIKPSAKHPALASEKPVPGQRIVRSFTDLNLRGDVVEALSEVGVTKPTVIQMLSIPKILRGKNVICASETGSGKTFAYLAPLISRLKDEEEAGLLPRLKHPRALILLPSRDLAAQVLSVTKSLCHSAKFRAVGLIRGAKMKYIREALSQPVDVAIATPDSLLKFRLRTRLSLSDVSHLVLDEADTLLDDSFKTATNSVIRSISLRSTKPPLPPARAVGAQVTVVGATLSDTMLAKVEKMIPNIKKVSSKHLHRVLPHLEQHFIKVRQDEKADRLLALMKNNTDDVFIVFCNTVPSCDWTAQYLKSHDVPVTKLHSGFAPSDRKNLLNDFQQGDSNILVCTDIASRGIDSIRVNHIVLFDFPFNMQDYLHRVGRTGRVGSKVTHPRVTAYMSHRKDIEMAWKIKDASSRQEAIVNKKVVHAMQKQSVEQKVSDTTKPHSLAQDRSMHIACQNL